MQNLVKQFNEEKMCHEKVMPVSARLLDVISEVGELGKEVLKSTKYGTIDFEMSDDFKMEFGDVVYSLLSLANETGIDAEECLKLAVDKYQKRIDSKNDMGSGN